MQAGAGTCVLVIVTVYLQGVLICGEEEVLRTYNIEDHCGFYVSRYEPAGILRFDSATFNVHHRNSQECHVTVTPEKVPGSGRNGRVLFYFTELSLPGACSDMSLTLTDGSSASDPVVARCPKVACGHNSSMTRDGMVFNTTGAEFSVVLRWSKPILKAPGSFVLKFSSFYDGPCKDDEHLEVDTTTCLNTRCTALKYHCHADIDTCGGGEEAVCEVKDVMETVVDHLVTVVKDVAIVVAIIIMIFLVFRFLKAMKERHGLLDDFLQKLTGRLKSQPEVRVRSRSPSMTTVEMNQQTGITDHLDQHDIQLSVADDRDTADTGSLNQSGPAAPPPSYDELSPLPTAPTLPFAAPPAYDDVISDETKYQYKS